MLAVIFLLVPIFLYLEFQAAYRESQKLLLRSVRDEGRVISQSLLPQLQNADTASLPQIGSYLSQFAGEVTTIKLLLAPLGAAGAGSRGFYYVASWPPVGPSNLRAERETLARQGVLDRLAQNCRGEMPFSLIYDRPTGGAEIVTAVTPLSTSAGCWAVVASFSAAAFPSAHLGEPYWATPRVRIALLIYLAMAAITFSTLLSVRGGLRRFAGRAQRIREEGPDAGFFANHAELPELEEVAAEFDRMVAALDRSAAEIRRTAEDNAHAFKTPIAVIRQSIEPLRRTLPPDNQRARRAIGLVESSLDRLDGLVASARRLDEATADLIAKPRVPVDLERVIGRLVQTQSAILSGRNLTIAADLMPATLVLGTEEMIETVLENLVDNAMSFSPPGGEVRVRLYREGRFVHVTVADSGPGVPEAQRERIFDRYFSERRAEAAGEAASTYFGIGLWIARRNVEAMGGTIEAVNGSPRGLVMHIRLPPARG
ncbi:MAG TPA: HAMP domain-containing sensor histidine kinase [Stellaceae bacterium]|nr:HAMP domain-containing sensor histidine kinase [Stellaceae bacterium]